MAGTKKVTVKSLSEEVCNLKEQVKELPILKKEISELKDLVRDLLNSKNGDTPNEETEAERIDCRKCDEKGLSKRSLKRHLSSKHALKIKCTICDEIFSKNYDLEVHIKSKHEPRELHKCDYCEKEFVLKWRLLKHQNNHNDATLRKCHYFNNDLTCPFDEMGCMFSHEVADMCRFAEKCTTNLCSFKHKKNPANISTENFNCQECDESLTSHTTLLNHVENVHVENEGKRRDYLFPQKCPNCPKWIYCDEENEEHYDDFEEFGRCEARKEKISASDSRGPCDPANLE